MASLSKYKWNGNTPNVKSIAIIAVCAIAVISVFVLFSGGYFVQAPPGGAGSTTTTLVENLGRGGNCGDLQLDINSRVDASGFYKAGLFRPATGSDQLVILDLTVTNAADKTKDFAGMRLELVSGTDKSIPQRFDYVDAIDLIGGGKVDFMCTESRLAYVGQLILVPGATSRGCKMFSTPYSSIPNKLNLYNSTGGTLLCSLQVP
jgi:hypothetical protein